MILSRKGRYFHFMFVNISVHLSLDKDNSCCFCPNGICFGRTVSSLDTFPKVAKCGSVRGCLGCVLGVCNVLCTWYHFGVIGSWNLDCLGRIVSRPAGHEQLVQMVDSICVGLQGIYVRCCRQLVCFLGSALFQ